VEKLVTENGYHGGTRNLNCYDGESFELQGISEQSPLSSANWFVWWRSRLLNGCSLWFVGGEGESSWWRHVNTLTLKLVSERVGYVQKVVKVKCTLRVMLSHPYIGAGNANGSRETRHHQRRPLVVRRTVEMESVCTLVRWPAEDLTCSCIVFCLVCLGLWLIGSYVYWAFSRSRTIFISIKRPMKCKTITKLNKHT